MMAIPVRANPKPKYYISVILSNTICALDLNDTVPYIVWLVELKMIPQTLEEGLSHV